MRPTPCYALLLLVLTSFAASGFGQDTYWAAKYSKFGGGRSPADLETLTHRFFEQTTLRRITVDAQTFSEAMGQVRVALREAHAEFGLGFTMSNVDYKGYSKPYHLHAQQVTLVEVIDRLATQGDLHWDFSAAGMLNFYPRVAPVVAPN